MPPEKNETTVADVIQVQHTEKKQQLSEVAEIEQLYSEFNESKTEEKLRKEKQ